MTRIDFTHGQVSLNHGNGGRAMADLIGQLFVAEFDNDYLGVQHDGAILPAPPAGCRLILATDGHVISPLFFPAGTSAALQCTAPSTT